MKFWLHLLVFASLAGVCLAGPAGTPATNAPASGTHRTFAVRGFMVEGNTLLPQPKIDSVLTNYVGPNVDIAQLTEGLGRLQLLYRHLGFATVSITLPQQKLTNGLVRVTVTEGRLSDIVIKGNRYYSQANIRRALPSLTTNIFLNSKWFQPELNQANANPDRQIYPIIGPGPDPGTTELTLKVKDQLPLHGHMDVDDRSTPGTPLLRVDTSVQYDNLWQLNHELGINYNFSPQEMKTDSYEPQFYNQPMVASYSTYYRIPLGSGEGLRQSYERQPVDFGYDEVSHTFKPLPATGNPELIVYASRSVSDTPVRYGPLAVVFTNTEADLTSESSERDLTYNSNAGTKLTLPVREFAGIRSSLLLGIDYKAYDAPSFNTNVTFFSLYAVNSTTGQRELQTNASISLPSNSHASLYYIPLSLGWTANRPDARGNTSFNINENIFLAALASGRANFQSVAGTTAAGGNYTDFTGGLGRLQNLPGDWSVFCRANGQLATAPLIANEEMALGGTAGVRGYREGEVYGDDGWRVLFDLNAPPIQIGEFATEEISDRVPAMIRCSVFTDYGTAYLIDRPTTSGLSYSQWGTGAGFFLTAGQHFYARLTMAWALKSTVLTPAGSAQAYFSVGWQF